LYPTRQLIVLTENYRSGAPVLDVSRAIITQAGDRLEQRIPELDKQLHAQTDKASVALWQAATVEAEYHAVAAAIQKQLADGVDPSSIAVLARRHADIKALLPYLSHANIVVRYEREESVLDSPPIQALEEVARVVVALAQGRHDHAEELLPKLLAHPAWGLDAATLWRLSLDAYKNRQHWMEIMATTPALTPIYSWLIEQAEASKATPLEPMVDALIGKPHDETDAETDSFHNPYYAYFFSKEALAHDPQAYLQCLTALRSLRTRLAEYMPDTTLALKDLVSFIELHRRLDITLLSQQYSLASDVPAVQLLTAHKSKGLEFDHVYIINSIDSAWGHSARSLSRSIGYPQNLPLQSGGNSADERLRLYYVAATRARKSLVMSFADAAENGKRTLLADFLVQLEQPVVSVDDTSPEAALEQAELAWWQPLATPTADLTNLLAPQLEKFKLSATSFNAFLDVSRGGPQEFLLNNLLHFPKTKAPAASYGTAIHWTMQQAHTHVLATGEQKPLEDVLHDFETALAKERLSEKDMAHYLQKGSQDVPQFLLSGVLPITGTQKAEVDFKHQNVVVAEARLTGSLDVLDVNTDEKTLIVTDYKTGRPAERWDSGDDHTKLKLHKYRQQLLFYKLLVEESSAYSAYTVTQGQLAFIEPTKSGESIVLSLDLSQEDIDRTRALITAVWKKVINLDLPDTSGYSPDFKGVLAFEQDLIDEIV
jgi:DNA helicase-2/ATP-dependent DNA helicase PcrA